MEYLSIRTIKKNPNNPRVIRGDGFKKLKESLSSARGKEHFEARPCIVSNRTGENIIIAGNTRYQAAKELGWDEIPVVVIQHLTEDQEREIIIRDNVSNGEWDWEKLANEWEAEKLVDWGLEIPESFETQSQEAREDGYEMPDEILTNIIIGDTFSFRKDGKEVSRLLCGDSTKVEDMQKLMGGEKADMVMTDPPYNVDYTGGRGMKIINDKMDNDDFYIFLYNAFKATNDHVKDGGGWYVWHADTEGLNFRRALIDSGTLLKQCLIWVKNAFVMGRQDYHWKHEPCLYGWKEGGTHYFTEERTHTTVIEDKIDFSKMSKSELVDILNKAQDGEINTTVLRADRPTKNDVHPTMKPILLIAPLIQNSTIKDSIVLDPFLGSGSTMVACYQLGRKCYGLELDPKYCQAIIERMRARQ